jgi:hypothetical protein
MQDKNLPVYDSEHRVVKVGSTLPFTLGDEIIQCFITKIDLEPKHTVVTIAEKMDGEPICYLHNRTKWSTV